ncbi:MAG: alpha-ketoacid dehydrogenase subunit beta, partial [Eubacteriales bacterium]
MRGKEGVLVREITYREAIREALREEMQRDENVFLMGEDIGAYGGVFNVTQGFLKEFGEKRVRDTPLSESVIMGSAVGAALLGVRPVVEIMFADFMPLIMDHLANNAAKMRYLYGGEASVPLVVRTPQGAGASAGMHHSQSLESWLMHVPGLKVLMPATPYDAKGLLKSAIRDDNPVVFLEHKMLYGVTGEVPTEEYLVPIGKADVKRQGRDVTVIATAMMLHRAMAAAGRLEQEGVGVEVLDPRTMLPLDREAIIESIKKTKRAVIVHEACMTGGPGAEIAAVIAGSALDYLDAPV